MPAMTPPSYADVKIDYRQLAFMLEAADPMLLLEITILQERFEQTLTAANRRSEFYVDEVQKEIARQNLNGKTMTLENMKEALGERVYGTISNFTNDYFEHLSSTIEAIAPLGKKLHDFAKSQYPAEKFITVEYLPKEKI